MSDETSVGEQPRCGAMASRADFGSSAAPCALPDRHDGDHVTADGRVRWVRRQQTSAGETGRREAMSEGRLAEIRRRHAAYAKSHAHMGAFACCSAHTSADTVPELLAEVERLNKHLAAIGVAHRDGMTARRRLGAIRDQEEAELRERAETAERELAEMRERIGAERVEWGVRWTDHHGSTWDDAKANESIAREFIKVWKVNLPDYDAHLIRRTKAGDWQVADGD